MGKVFKKGVEDWGIEYRNPNDGKKVRRMVAYNRKDAETYLAVVEMQFRLDKYPNEHAGFLMTINDLAPNNQYN